MQMDHKFKVDHESAVYRHMNESGHQVYSNNVEVLDSASSDYKLKLNFPLFQKDSNMAKTDPSLSANIFGFKCIIFFVIEKKI
ncbi:unnamed protein product [Brachionus calyciflorus]|uniref:Uncharacterized protein n=1 Tax=Brachionus calyciflorus TaxID=104777 RepID=A0A814M7G9_9BILA|nr:unnamed protein product [Brachionus calyciflorus]